MSVFLREKRQGLKLIFTPETLNRITVCTNCGWKGMVVEETREARVVVNYCPHCGKPAGPLTYGTA
jgi:hypothetical protein